MRTRLAIAVLLVSPAFAQRPFGRYLMRVCTVLPFDRTVWCVEPPAPPPAGLAPAATMPTPQAITMTQVSSAAGNPSGVTPSYPVAVGDDFYVQATSNSGLPVTQTPVEGSTLLRGGVGVPENSKVTQYHASAPGTVVIRATRLGDGFYADAPPVLLAVQIADRPAPAAACSLLPAPKPSAQAVPLIDAAGIVTLLGTPTPFVLAAQGPNTIFIYSTRMPLPAPAPAGLPPVAVALSTAEQAILDGLPNRIALLLGHTQDSLGVTPAAKPFSVEFRVPHAQAMGDLATKLGTLNYSQFTIADVGPNKVRVTSATQPACDVWTSFLTDVREVAWGIRPASLTSRLFYLANSDVPSYVAAPDVANAFVTLANGGGGPASVSGSGSPSGSGTPNASGGGAGGGSAAGTPSAGGSSTPAPAAGASSTAPAGGSSPNASIAITQPPGSVLSVKSDTTPCVVAGLAMSNSSACAPPGGSTAAPGGAAAPAGGGAGSAAPAPNVPSPPKPVAMASLGPDQLIFSTTNPGDDAAVVERERLLALLDLPRPEMILNGWVIQDSTVSSEAMGAFNTLVKDTVNEFNDSLDRVVFVGWKNLKTQMQTNRNYFDPMFYHYVSDHYVADTHDTTVADDAGKAAEIFLETSQSSLADPGAGEPLSTFGVCDRGKYCLGYTNLFQPLRPRLTDLLLAIAAAKNPLEAVNRAIDDIEYPPPPPQCCVPTPTDHGHALPAVPGPPDRDHCPCPSKIVSPELTKRLAPGFCGKYADDRESREECDALWSALDMGRLVDQKGSRSCESDDIAYAFVSDFPSPDSVSMVYPRRHIFLECLRQVAVVLLSPPDSNNPSPSTAGLLRADIADFLFNYKMSQQYPHEFVPYYLSQSAATLNTALAPLIDAFNRDVTAFQRYLHSDVTYKVGRLNREHDQRCCVKRLFGLDKPSFFNDGMVTVRTISGQWTSVSATSQSFLNASAAPQLSTILGSVPGVTPSTAGAAAATGGGSATLQTIANIASAYQTTFAQIGRSLAITALPRSLATASSAEIVVSLNADESAPPSYFGGAQNGSPANISRVANHDTSTRVRIESTKLFEVSSFSAALQKSQSRFPLIPPFVEIPYIGTIAGIPLPAAREFHTSTAILSAIVVPTAADLAYGLDFQDDKLVEGDSGTCSYRQGISATDTTKPCRLRNAVSMHDLMQNGQSLPIDQYNHAMVKCLATDMNSAYSTIHGFSAASKAACENLSLDRVPQEAQ